MTANRRKQLFQEEGKCRPFTGKFENRWVRQTKLRRRWPFSPPLWPKIHFNAVVPMELKATKQTLTIFLSLSGVLGVKFLKLVEYLCFWRHRTHRSIITSKRSATQKKGWAEMTWGCEVNLHSSEWAKAVVIQTHLRLLHLWGTKPWVARLFISVQCLFPMAVSINLHFTEGKASIQPNCMGF